MAAIIAGISGAIGQALALKYLDEFPEQPVIGLCRNPAKAAEAMGKRPGLQLRPWDAESAAPLVVDEALAQTLADSGGIHRLVYAAGLLHDDRMFPEKRLEDLTADNLARAFQVNCVGFGLLVQALAPWFRGPQLTRVAAISAKVGSISDNHLGGWYAYRCSKAALNMLVKNLSVELPRRYRPLACVALHPGTTRSALSEPFSQSLASLTVHESEGTADNLFQVIERLGEADNGRFIGWDGGDLPW